MHSTPRVETYKFKSHITCKAACKRAQQLPTLLRQQCWELLRACWQWSANGCNNSQQCWDLQCIVGRIQPMSLCKPCVMSVRGPNNVGGAAQTDSTLLRYASAITEQKKCWEFLAQNFDRFQTKRTTPNNTQQHVIECANDPTCIIQQCCVRLQEALLPKGYSHIWAIRYVSLNRVFFDFPDFVTGYKNYPLSLKKGYILLHKGRFFPIVPDSQSN